MKCDTLLWSHKAAWGGNASSTLSHSMVTSEVVTDEPQATLKTFQCWAGWERTRPLGDCHPKDSVVPSWEGSPGPHSGPRTIFSVLLVFEKSGGLQLQGEPALTWPESHGSHFISVSFLLECAHACGGAHTHVCTRLWVSEACVWRLLQLLFTLYFFRVSH